MQTKVQTNSEKTLREDIQRRHSDKMQTNADNNADKFRQNADNNSDRVQTNFRHIQTKFADNSDNSDNTSDRSSDNCYRTHKTIKSKKGEQPLSLSLSVAVSCSPLCSSVVVVLDENMTSRNQVFGDFSCQPLVLEGNMAVACTGLGLLNP